MVIEEDESIIDYGTRFQKACHEGNIQDSNHLAMRFLSSLTSNLSANVKLAWFASHSKMPQLVKQELTLASSIAAGNKCSDNERFASRKVYNLNKNITKNKFFCTQHKYNNSHTTKDDKMLTKVRLNQK
ncbi:hypothetical protein F4703DRAFT_1799716 [Phycomyces blakesleeanus]